MVKIFYSILKNGENLIKTSAFSLPLIEYVHWLKALKLLIFFISVYSLESNMLVFSIYDSVRPYFTFIRWSLGICLNLVKIVPLLLPQAFMISALLIPTPNENSRACSNKIYISRNSGSVISLALKNCSNFCFSSNKTIDTLIQ